MWGMKPYEGIFGYVTISTPDGTGGCTVPWDAVPLVQEMMRDEGWLVEVSLDGKVTVSDMPVVVEGNAK